MTTAQASAMTAPTTNGIVYDETGRGVFVPAAKPSDKERHEAVRADQKAMTIVLPDDFFSDWK